MSPEQRAAKIEALRTLLPGLDDAALLAMVETSEKKEQAAKIHTVREALDPCYSSKTLGELWENLSQALSRVPGLEHQSAEFIFQVREASSEKPAKAAPKAKDGEETRVRPGESSEEKAILDAVKTAPEEGYTVNKISQLCGLTPAIVRVFCRDMAARDQLHNTKRGPLPAYRLPS